ncbi:hypothetical protein ACQP2P_23070 [Dactylosporangium sp. CA-139114]|uniref:hypothetical protein n=1 Tax=Dactylosporangium sp. CA-139114 TaxID=3239931 RepID=UPI003D956D04
MARPTDWDKVGLGSDPTPGDPGRIDEVIASIRDLGQVARDVDDGLAAVLETAGPNAFVGQTADALREKISDRLRGFVQSLAEAFEWSVTALTTYNSTLRDQQWRADNALSQARNLAEDDPSRQGFTDTARNAGTAVSDAATTASNKIVDAYEHIKQPVSGCEEFWEIFKWLAIALILPALVFGGPIALVALGVNMVLFIKTAVDFAQGKASALEFFLSALGILAPTTRAVPIFQLIKTGAQLAWNGLKAGAFAVFKFFGNTFKGIISHPFVLFPGLHDMVALSGSWVKGAGLWVQAGIKDLPSFMATTLGKGGLIVVNGVKGIGNVVAGIPGFLAKFGSSTWTFLQREFGGNRWLRLFLPAEADELHLGVWQATKLAVWDRGVLGKHIFGLPKPHPVLPERGVDLPSIKLAEVRAGDLAVPPRLQMPKLTGFGGLGHLGMNPPSMHIPTSFGDSLHFSGDAVRNLDALLLSPMDTISKVRVEAWAERAVNPVLANVDHITGISSAVHLQPPTVAHLAGGTAISSTVHALDLPGLHLTPPAHTAGTSTLHALDLPGLHLNATANGATTLHALDLPSVHVNQLVNGANHLNPPHLQAPHLDVPGLGNVGALHTGAVPPAPVHAIDALGSAAVSPPSLHLMNGAPTSALNGAGGRIADHTSLAINAQHVSMDLGSVTRHLDTPAVHVEAPAVNAIVTPAAVTHVASTAPPAPVTHLATTTPPAPVTHLVNTPTITHTVDTTAHIAATPPPVHVNLAPVEHTPAVQAPAVHTANTVSTVRTADVATVHTGNVAPAHVAGAPKVDDLVVAAPVTAGPKTAERTPTVVNPAHNAGTGVQTGATLDPIGATAVAGLVQTQLGGRLARAETGLDNAIHSAGSPGKTVSLPGGGIEGAWRRDSDRIGELFGGADDPLRAKKIETWAAYTRARNELGRVEQTWNDIMDRPGGSSRGPTAVEVRAERTYAAAITRVDRIARDLKTLGIDPVTMDLRIAEITAESVRARPRLLGGGQPFSKMAPEPFDPHVPMRDVHGSASDLRIEIHTVGNVESLRVVDAGGVGRPEYVAVAHGDGGFQVTDMIRGEEFRRFDDVGNLLATGRPVQGHAGWSHVTPTGAQPHLEVPAGFQANPHAGGGFQVDNLTNPGHFERFDINGTLTHTGRPVQGHAGWSHVTPTGAQPHLEVPAGFRSNPHAGGFQVDNLTDVAHFERFDINGTLTHTGRPVQNHAGWSHVTPHGGGQPHLEVPAGFQANPHAGGGFQVDNLTNPGHFERFDINGTLTHTGRPIQGHPGWSHVTPQGGGEPYLEVPAGFRSNPHAGGFQVDNLTNVAHFERFDINGTLTHVGVRADNLAGNVEHLLVNPVGGGWHAEHAVTGAQIPHLRVQRLAGNDFRVTDTRGLHNGEYRVHNPDGAVTAQSFNVLRDGRPTVRQFVADVPNGTWRLHENGAPVVNPGPFQRGTADFAGAVNGRVKLLTDTGAEMFHRRPVPGANQTLDVFRTVGNDLRGGQRPQWAKFDQTGTLVDHGVRRFDNSAVSWRDVSHTGTPSHAIRQSLGGGEVIATRDALGQWRWTRVDQHGAELGSGVRTVERDGGWTDRMAPGAGGAPGAIAQRQHGPWHGPDSAGMYKEYDLAGGAPAATWKSQSPHGKDAGKLQNLPNGSTLETARWSEQRPPHWARRFLAGIPGGVFRLHENQFLRTDTKFQVFTWTRMDPGAVRTDGFRFVSMSEAAYDVGRDGRFVRYTGKLEHGNTLTVGHDVVPLPAGAARNPLHVPWSEGAGNLSGYRVSFGRGVHADGRVWEDRFVTAGDWYAFNNDYRVARAGYADGSIREFQRPPAAGAAGGGFASRIDAFEGVGRPWVQRDIHGVVVGRCDEFPTMAPGGGTVHVEATGGATTRRWTWTDGTNSGTRDWGRNFNGPHTTFDDSFRDFQRVNGVDVLVRERRMLDGGAYVDAWRVDNAAGGHTWHWHRVDRHGNVTAPLGAGREWWNGRAWHAEWSPGATRFRDLTGPTLVRDVPAADVLRVREYRGGDLGVWKEFDMGAVVRERKPLPGVGFIEKDAWRGQWRQYDAAGTIVARRDDAGWVHVPGLGRGLDLAGRELDYRGWASQVRGWNRRIRESNRMAWGGELHVGNLNEALYKPYWQHAAQKIALEFAQEFLLEFAANLVVNAIVDAIAGKQFNGQDALKAFANAAVGSAVKSAVGSVMHENRFGPMQRTADLKAGLANIDGGKAWFRKPLNHDKHWSNEWAGNETATRWRGGTYDFAFNVPVAGLTGFVNGAMNASVFGITNADGDTIYLSGGAAAFDGLLAAASGITGAVTTTIGKTLFNAGLGGRAFHRQGLAEFGFQLPWKIVEKVVTSELLKAFRPSVNPWYYQPGGWP